MLLSVEQTQAAFIKARNHLRDKEGLVIPRTSKAHRDVSKQFENSTDAVRRSLGEKLIRLRRFHRQADYVDTFPGLSGIIQTALRISLGSYFNFEQLIN